jgi:hypothetical protein
MKRVYKLRSGNLLIVRPREGRYLIRIVTADGIPVTMEGWSDREKIDALLAAHGL